MTLVIYWHSPFIVQCSRGDECDVDHE